MIPVRTPKSNVILKGPAAHEGEPIVHDLPCQRISPQLVKSTWDLTHEERIAIAEGAQIDLYVMTLTPHPPVMLEISDEPRELEPPPGYGGRQLADDQET